MLVRDGVQDAASERDTDEVLDEVLDRLRRTETLLSVLLWEAPAPYAERDTREPERPFPASC